MGPTRFSLLQDQSNPRFMGTIVCGLGRPLPFVVLKVSTLVFRHDQRQWGAQVLPTYMYWGGERKTKKFFCFVRARPPNGKLGVGLQAPHGDHASGDHRPGLECSTTPAKKMPLREDDNGLIIARNKIQSHLGCAHFGGLAGLHCGFSQHLGFWFRLSRTSDQDWPQAAGGKQASLRTEPDAANKENPEYAGAG